jgi:hypothetical protein
MAPLARPAIKRQSPAPVSRLDVTYLVAGVCGIAGVAAFVGLILVPAVSSYTGGWQRAAAAVLSFYVLAAMVGLGVLGAYGVYELWIRYG